MNDRGGWIVKTTGRVCIARSAAATPVAEHTATAKAWKERDSIGESTEKEGKGG